MQLRANRSLYGIAVTAILLLAAPSWAQLDTFSLKKGVAREAGEPVEEPHDFEACIEFLGEGVDDLELTVPTNPVRLESANDPDEVCFSENFLDAGELDTAFPNSPTASDPYGVAALLEGSEVDSIDILYDLEEPKAWVDFTEPEDGSEVPEGGSLTITWEVMEKEPCLSTASCGDTLLLTVENEATGEPVFEGEFDVAGSQQILDPGSLEADQTYQISGMILNSAEESDQETNGGGVFVTTLTLYEDDNIITVPEPGPLAASAGALVALLGLARRRGPQNGAP
ncbi:MAG: hypothetical protein ABFS46_17485 [Myxococcota bacterium]